MGLRGARRVLQIRLYCRVIDFVLARHGARPSTTRHNRDGFDHEFGYQRELGLRAQNICRHEALRRDKHTLCCSRYGFVPERRSENAGDCGHLNLRIDQTYPKRNSQAGRVKHTTGHNDRMRSTMTTSRPHGHFDVLDGLSLICKNAVIERCRRRVVAKGKTVWRQGEPADYVIIVLSGKVISWHEAPNGKAGTIGFWTAGDIAGLGDMGLTNVWQHTLQSLEASSLMTLSFRDFDDLARQFPEFSLRVIRAFSVRLRWVAQLAVTLTTTSAVERICAVLLTLTERFGVADERGMLIDLKLTNEQLAAICGISRQFANSTLQALQIRSLISAQQES